MTMTSLKQPEIITVPAHADEVACDGGNGALGHPMVYYTFDGAAEVRCGYCDRLFRRQGGSGANTAGHIDH
ncbi:MAG TPA: zinc-finger domain-containing protein [Alphaproteobacteria bacterium]